MNGGDVGRRAWGCEEKKEKKKITYADGWWSTRTDGWCACGPVACGGRRGVFVAVDADGWMVVVLAVEPGDVKKKRKKEKEKFYLRGWIVVDAGGWWPFRRAVAVVAVYTADVEEERKKKKKGKDLLWWVLAVDACSGIGGRRAQWW